VIFSLRSNVFEAHFQEPSTLWKVKIAMDTLAQNLEIEKSYSNIFKYLIFDAKIKLQKNVFF